MNYSEFLKVYEKLNKINSTLLTESTEREIDLADCRIIVSDVVDIRGELEKSACLVYNNELTRIQVRTVIIRETIDGKEFLAKKFRHKMALPGGGYDVEKDDGNILNSAKREAYEEVNLNLTGLKDTGVRTWRHREDPWVEHHIKNSENRWTGYYSYYVVGKVASTGDNKNPEEINKWKWYPIEQLEKINKEVYNYVMRLDESWGDGQNLMGEQEVTYPDMLSYCCENPSSLALILESGLIKAASIPETHETDTLHSAGRGRKAFAKYPYVSFSKQLYSHAYRRPNKWSFGLAVSEKALQAKGYDFTDRNHEYNSLAFNGIFTTEGPNPSYMAQTSLYGFVEITKEIYDLIYKAMREKGQKEREKASDTEILSGKLTKKAAWEVRTKAASEKSMANANSQLKNLKFTSKTAFPGSGTYSLRYVVGQSDFSKTDWDTILEYLLNYTYYNEGERRVWCKNGEPGVKFSADDLYGIILPKVIIEDFIEAGPDSEEIREALNLSTTQVAALKTIWNYVDQHDLDLLIHDATDAVHLATLDKDRGIKTGGR